MVEPPVETPPVETPVVEAPVEPAPAPESVAAARADLVSINELLRKIELLLANRSALTTDELAVLERSIAALKERAALYGTGRE